MSIIGKLEEGILWRRYNGVVTSADPGAAQVWILNPPWTDSHCDLGQIINPTLPQFPHL